MPIAHLLSCLPLLLIAQAHPQARPAREDGPAKWEKLLIAAFKEVQIPVLADVDTSMIAPYGDTEVRIKGQLSLERWSSILRRKPERIEGSIVLIRSRAVWPGQGAAVSQVVKTLAGLSEAQRKLLTSRGLYLDEISPDQSRLLVSYACATDPQMALAFLNRANQVRVSLRFTPTVRVKRPAAPGYYSLLQDGHSEVPEHKRQAPPEQDLPLAITSPPGSAPISFGSGRVLKLGELVQQLVVDHKLWLRYDNRLNDMPLFIKGDWTEKQLVAAAERVTRTMPTEKYTIGHRLKMADIHALLLGPFRSALDEYGRDKAYSAEDALAGKEVRMSDLDSKITRLDELLHEFGLTRDSRGNLAAEFTLHYDFGGLVRVRGDEKNGMAGYQDAIRIGIVPDM